MIKNIVISLLAILALCGCQEELAQKEDMTPGVKGKTFTAVIDEGFSSTKTSLDEKGNVRWKQGDQISIFEGSTINQQYQVTDASDGKTSAELQPVSSSGFVAGGEIGNNVAFYPYQSSAAIAKSDSAYIISDITLPSAQNYAEGSFGNGAFPMVAVTSSTSDMFLKFRNVLGALKLQLTGTASIVSIEITGNNSEILCGAASVTASNKTTPSIELTEASAQTVTLDCGAGVALNSETATSFVIALPPMTMTGGFTVVVKDSEGKEMEIKTTKEQIITRSGILKMPAVNYVGTPKPLTFTSTGATEISLCKIGTPYDITLEYKVNNGDWVAYTIGDAISLSDNDKVSFQAGAGGNSQFSKAITNDGGNCYSFNVSGSGTVAASGNIMSLVDQTVESLIIPNSDYFTWLFKGCSSLTMAPELPATTLAENCYAEMFLDCTALTIAPELPAATLANSCYYGMFRGCTSLVTAPTLPATNLASLCYGSMFYGCTTLTSAPELPAITLTSHCYEDMFNGCTSLVNAPALSATTLAPYCYSDMFAGCTALTKAPELPATNLASYCYAYMFQSCTALTSAPELPATTLASYCYNGMFYGCSALTSTPELPATTVAQSSYQTMFYNCSVLTSAPELPATTLADDCYYGMFSDCTSLTTAPELPATTLAYECYSNMFSGCTSLTTAPELPATTLASNCYRCMFMGCTNLNYVKALFTTTPSDSYTEDWLSEVSSSGTFVKSKDATWDVTGVNGVPSGWSIKYEVEAVDLGLSVKWATCNVGAFYPEEYGTYFAWGDVVGQTWNGSSWSGGGFSSSSYPSYELDANNNLKPEYDAAHVNLYGNWRMPTNNEYNELKNNCTCTWTSDYKGSGVAGRIFTSNKTGYTDKSIFLPAAGGGENSDDLYRPGVYGYYWSSTCGQDIWSWDFFFNSGSGNFETGTCSRYKGRSVRPVCP